MSCGILAQCLMIICIDHNGQSVPALTDEKSVLAQDLQRCVMDEARLPTAEYFLRVLRISTIHSPAKSQAGSPATTDSGCISSLESIGWDCSINYY